MGLGGAGAPPQSTAVLRGISSYTKFQWRTPSHFPTAVFQGSVTYRKQLSSHACDHRVAYGNMADDSGGGGGGGHAMPPSAARRVAARLDAHREAMASTGRGLLRSGGNNLTDVAATELAVAAL